MRVISVAEHKYPIIEQLEQASQFLKERAKEDLAKQGIKDIKTDENGNLISANLYGITIKVATSERRKEDD